MEKLNLDNIEKLLHFEPSEKIFVCAIKGLKSQKRRFMSKTDNANNMFDIRINSRIELRYSKDLPR